MKFQREAYGRKGVRYVSGDYTIRAFRAGSRIEAWIPEFKGEPIKGRGDTLADAKRVCQQHAA